MLDKLEGATTSAVTWLVGALLGGVGWLIRRVFTNQKQIEALERELASREKLRGEDRERIAGIETDVRQIKNILIERK